MSGPPDGTAEIWRPIPDLTGYYVSWFGRVVGPSGKVLKAPINRCGYYALVIRRNSHLVHHLVTRAYLGPRPDGLQVRHLNGIKLDNWLGNLAYGSARENTLDSVEHGSHPQARKTHCINGHEYSAANTLYNAKGHRRCRECYTGHSRRYAQQRTTNREGLL